MSRTSRVVTIAGTMLAGFATTPAYAHPDGALRPVWHSIQHAVPAAGVVLVVVVVGLVRFMRNRRVEI